MNKLSLLLTVLVITFIAFDISEKFYQNSLLGDKQQSLPKSLTANDTHFNDLVNPLLRLKASLAPAEIAEQAEIEYEHPENQSGELKNFFNNGWKYKLLALVVPDNESVAFGIVQGTELKSNQTKVLQLFNGGDFMNYHIQIAGTEKLILKKPDNTIQLVMYESNVAKHELQNKG